jgi:hypothetical protein
MADETDDDGLKALTKALALKPYRPNPSFLSEAGQALGQQAAAQPAGNRGEYFQNMALKLASSLLGGFGREEELQETRGAYGRLNQALSSKNPGLAISQDPYWYDSAPSFMLDAYARQGKIADETAIAKMKTREKYASDYMNVDPETQQTSFYPGLVESQGRQKYIEAGEGAKGRLEQEEIYQPLITAANLKQQGLLAPEVEKKKKLAEVIAQTSPEYITAKQQVDAPGVEDLQRKEFMGQKTVQDFPIVDQYFNQMVSAFDDYGPGSDLSFIYGAMKVVDPGSSVKDSEASMAEHAGGFPAAIQGALQTVLGRGQLSEKQRIGLMQVSRRFYDKHADQVNTLRTGYENLSKSRGANVGNVLIMPPPRTTESILGKAGLLPRFAAYDAEFRNRPPGSEAIPIQSFDPSKVKDPVLRERLLQKQAAQYAQPPAEYKQSYSGD